MDLRGETFSAEEERRLEADARSIFLLFDKVGEERLWGTPRLSDADFITAVHRRVEPAPASSSRWVFVIPRLVPASAAACLVLTVLIFFGASRWTPPEQSLLADDTSALDVLDITGIGAAIDQAELPVDETEAAELADFLGIPSLEEHEASYEWDYLDPITDELLALDEQDLSEVLNELQETKFF